MKRKLFSLFCVAVFGLLSINAAHAQKEPLEAVGDIVLVRPLSFVGTVIGSALFVVALPITATSKSTKATAEVLVIHPAQFTFTRPIGDFSSWQVD